MLAATLREDLLGALEAVLGTRPGIAVIHSSFVQLAPPVPLNAWDVLYAIGRIAGRGWTIGLPAFTFSFCKGRPFDVSNSPSETGMLADQVLAHFPTALRTANPIYSFVVLGPKAAKIAGLASTTTFGDDSPFGYFERENARVVMLGCGWTRCTLFHRYEEKGDVPYRYFKEFHGERIGADGVQEPASAKMYVRDLELAPQNDFMPAVGRLDEAKKIARISLWRGTVEACSAVDIAKTCMELLEGDRLSFLSNRAAVDHQLTYRAEAASQPPFRVAVLGSANIDLAKAALEQELAALLPQRRVELFTVPYGQLGRQLVEQGSDLQEFKPHLSIFCDRLEDLLGKHTLDVEDEAAIAESAGIYARNLAAFHLDNGGWTIVHDFALLTRQDAVSGLRLAAMVDAASRGLHETLESMQQIVWIDPSLEASQVGVVHDPRLWYLGRFRYARAFEEHLARRWAGAALSILGKTTRLIVVDLDNTLWGGVLGEDGIEGIRIGCDYPGNAFRDLQKVLRELSGRGIAIAIASKNDEDLAIKALNEHPEMVIRAADFVARRINWNSKWSNIYELAEELSLGLESVLFVDDNPVEREAVKRNLPQVKVLELPLDPAGYADALRNSPFVEAVRIGSEDLKRVDSYKARRKIEIYRTQSASLEDFLFSLRMTIHFQVLNEGNVARAAQLCQKTNQFNTTTRRYEARDLQALVQGGADVAVIGLEDRSSSKENIGLIVLKPDSADARIGDVDLFLMSCRVLGRGIERAVIEWAVGRARERGWRELRGEIVETARNTPARRVFGDNGFERGPAPGWWQRDTQTSPTISPWFQVADAFRTRKMVPAIEMRS